MRILLVDDHPLFLEGLKNILLAQGFDVLDTAKSGEEALNKVRRLLPDVVLMDIMMKSMSGLQATRLIKENFSEVKIIMLTTSEKEEDIFEAIKSGASGYLLKDLNSDELYEMLEKCKHGEIPLSPSLATKMLPEFKESDYGHLKNNYLIDEKKISKFNSLSARQKEVLVLVAKGVKYKDIATQLYITERTVKYHIEAILNKLHMENRSEAVKYIIQKGLVD